MSCPNKDCGTCKKRGICFLCAIVIGIIVGYILCRIL